MPIAKFQMPDGRIARFDVPEGTTPEQAQAMGESYASKPGFDKSVGEYLTAAEEAKSRRDMTHVVQKKPDFRHYTDYGLGLLNGATDIGATLLSPFDASGLPYSRPNRRDELKQFYAERANTGGMPYKAGNLTANVLGTAGVGGLLAKGAKAAGAVPEFVTALQSGGFSGGDALMRLLAGAATGAATAGMINPGSAGVGAGIGAAMPTAAKLAGGAARTLLGATTGVGDDAVRTAYQSGRVGNRDFTKHMRGQAQFDDVVDQAKAGLMKMRQDRAAAYRSGMVDIRNDKTMIDMKPIVQSVRGLQSMGSYKGQVINKNAAGTVDDIAETVNNWASLDPADYHTPEGLDALKQAIGDIRDATQFGTPARRASDQVYNAIKVEINKQAPAYAKVMHDYSEASGMLDEITKALSLGDKAAKDTAIRKLQSLMRNNAQTNYGNRMNLAAELEQRGDVNLKPALAGQAMNTWMPRGISGAMTKVGLGGGAVLSPESIPVLAGAAPFASPRLVGEMLYGLGGISKASPLLRTIPIAAGGQR